MVNSSGPNSFIHKVASNIIMKISYRWPGIFYGRGQNGTKRNSSMEFFRHINME